MSVLARSRFRRLLVELATVIPDLAAACDGVSGRTPGGSTGSSNPRPRLVEPALPPGAAPCGDLMPGAGSPLRAPFPASPTTAQRQEQCVLAFCCLPFNHNGTHQRRQEQR